MFDEEKITRLDFIIDQVLPLMPENFLARLKACHRKASGIQGTGIRHQRTISTRVFRKFIYWRTSTTMDCYVATMLLFTQHLTKLCVAWHA